MFCSSIAVTQHGVGGAQAAASCGLTGTSFNREETSGSLGTSMNLSEDSMAMVKQEVTSIFDTGWGDEGSELHTC